MKQITFNGNKNIFSEILLEERKKQNISQNELAARLQIMNINVDQQIISKIEKNQRQVTDYELAGFCSILKISPAEIMKRFNDLLV